MQREELDTKLDNMRMEMRAEASERRGELDRFRVEIFDWKQGIEVALTALNGKVDLLSERLDALSRRVDLLCQSMSTMKYWIAGSAITTLIGMFAMVWTVQQSTLQSIGVGGAMQQQHQAVLDKINHMDKEVRQQQDESREKLIAIQHQLEKLQSSEKD